MDPADLGATELTALFAKGSLSPLEALDAALRRIRRLNPVLNAIVTLDPEGARSAARASTARWAKRAPLSPLDGVPVTIKDTGVCAPSWSHQIWPCVIGYFRKARWPQPPAAELPSPGPFARFTSFLSAKTLSYHLGLLCGCVRARTG